jgi:hypothetical protein
VDEGHLWTDFDGSPGRDIGPLIREVSRKALIEMGAVSGGVTVTVASEQRTRRGARRAR